MEETNLPPEKHRESLEGRPKMPDKMLVAIDDSTSTTPAVDYAAGMARRLGAAIHVVHVNPRVVGGRGHTYLTLAEAKELVGNAVEQFFAVGLSASGSVAIAGAGAEAQAIASVAESTGATMIVLGSRRYRRWGHLRGLGVHERLVSLTHLPIVTAPAPLQLSELTVLASHEGTRKLQLRS